MEKTLSLLTSAFLMEKFGPLLNEEQLASVLHTEPGTIRNQRSSGVLGIPCIRRGKIPLYHAEDVAGYIDAIRTAAATR